MPVRLITGKSGSGKSLFMLHQLVSRFFDYDKVKQLFVPLPGFEDLLIITNIDGFSQDIPHLNLQEQIEYINFRKMCHEIKKLILSGRVPDVLAGFTVEKMDWYISEYQFEGVRKLPVSLRDYYIEERKEVESDHFFRNKTQAPYLQGHLAGKKIVYVIDEAQRYFPVGFKDRDACFFFEYHRHYGVEVFMATQHRNFLSRGIRDNIEVEYSSVRKSITSGRVYIYNVLYDGVKSGVEYLRNPKRYYSLYTSAFSHSDVKEKNYVFRILFFSSLCIFGAIGFITWRFVFSGRFSSPADQKSLASVRTLPSSPGSVSAGSGPSSPASVKSSSPEPAAPVLEWQKVQTYCLDDQCFFLSDVGFVPIPPGHKKFGNSVYMYLPRKPRTDDKSYNDRSDSDRGNVYAIGGRDT